jgi:hypothetical protein
LPPLPGQTSNPDRLIKQNEQEIIGKVRWRILWDSWPTGFRVSGPEARIAIAMTTQSFYFCSRNLHGCIQYWNRYGHVGRDIHAKVLEGQLSETDALIQWMRENGEMVVPPATGRPSVLRGVANSSPLLWTMDMKLPTQAELIEEYKQLRPSQLGDLRAWLISEHQRSDYESMTIGCFAPTDESVFVYGYRKTLGPIVLSLFNDIELGWTVAAFSDRPDEAKYIATMRDRIEELACGRIDFRP